MSILLTADMVALTTVLAVGIGMDIRTFLRHPEAIRRSTVRGDLRRGPVTAQAITFIKLLTPFCAQ